jgi:hypothetical protein
MKGSHIIPVALAALFGSVTGTAAASDIAAAEVVRSFPGNKGPGWKDSIDVAGAVGPRHVVGFDVAGFVVHDKASGKVLRQLSTREFWKSVEPAGKLVPQKDANDARMLYDPLSERWFACAAGTTEADCFLAVSISSDPTRPWRGAKLPLPRINPYMRMGVDRNGLYVCSCNGNPDMNKGTNCYVIPKRDVLADGGPVLTRARTFKNLQFSAMPATDPDADKPADAPAILLANEFAKGTCSKLYLYKITWSGPKASISDVQTIDLGRKYLTPDNSTAHMEAFQPKPGPKLRAGGGGRRIDSAFVRKGSVFGCNGAIRKAGSRPGALWYEVRISDGRLIQEGLVESPDRDFIFPSVAVDSRGNVGIGCTGTSQTEFPSVYVMMRAATDPAGTMRRPVAAVPGTTSYHYAGAGAVNLSHYSTTCIDPSSPGLLWTCQAYSSSKKDRQWCTAWAAFQLSDAKRSTPLPNTGPSTRAGSRKCKSYDHEDGDRSFRLVVPDGLEVVRGILAVGPYAGGDSRELHKEVWYREFMHLHGFAFLGAKGFYGHDYKLLQGALKQFAKDSKHPELVDAPYAATGFSAGGGFTRRLLMAAPGRVIAAVIVGSTLKLGAKPTAAHFGVPVCVINGELEHEKGEAGGMANALEPVLAKHRPKGALWGWMAAPGIGHEIAGQEVLTMPILDAAVRLRYPADGDVRKGPVKLEPVDLNTGWVADNTTWKSGLTAVTPARDFKGKLEKSSWLLNEDVAFVYRAYATLDRPLKITSPRTDRDQVWDAGSSVTIKVDDSRFAGWKKLELYDGAKKVGTIEKGKAEFTVKDLKAGYHAFSVLGTDAKGTVRPSGPVLVVVQKPAATSRP